MTDTQIYDPASRPISPPRNGAGIASLVMGILSFFLPVILGIPAVIAGIIALIRLKKGQATSKIGPMIGITCAVISTVLAILILKLVVLPIYSFATSDALANLTQDGLEQTVLSPAVENGIRQLGLDSLDCNGAPEFKGSGLTLSCSGTDPITQETVPVVASCATTPEAIQNKVLDCFIEARGNKVPLRIDLNDAGNILVTPG